MSYKLAFAVLIVTALSLSLSALPTVPSNTWYEIPNSKIKPLDPCPQRTCAYSAIGGQTAVITAWNGGIYDTKRNHFVVWGGGHADYYGNEVYSFDLNALAWTRITDPYPNPVLNQEINGDGTPNSRHNYGGNAYIAHADRFFTRGGSLAGSGFATCNLTWTFDFGALKWTNRNPANPAPSSFGATCSYDSVTRKVYWGSLWNFWSYDYDANAWAKLSEDYYFYDVNSCIDTKRGLFVSVGGGTVMSYDIKNANWVKKVWATTGDASIASGKPGLDYDPVNDRIVAWKGGAVYALNPDTKVWTSVTPSGTAPSCVQQGTYGRWRYVPAIGAFITVGGVDENVFFYKLPGGTGINGTPRPGSGQEGQIAVSPNPFRGMTTLRTHGRVSVYDLEGRKIAWLGHGLLRSAPSEYRWNSGALPAGIYTVLTETQGHRTAKTVTLLR